jgi:hypothetical protein
MIEEFLGLAEKFALLYSGTLMNYKPKLLLKIRLQYYRFDT